MEEGGGVKGRRIHTFAFRRAEADDDDVARVLLRPWVLLRRVPDGAV